MDRRSNRGIRHARFGLQSFDPLCPDTFGAHGRNVTTFRKHAQRPFVIELRCNTMMETIGERVRRIRDAKAITRKELARRAGLSYTGLASLEAGKAKSTTKLHRIADVLGVRADYLATGKSHAHATDDDGPQPVRLDAERVAELVTVMTERWHKEGRTLDLRDEATAERFVEAYEAFAHMKEQGTPDNVVAFSMILARSPQGAKDGPGADVPATGTARRHVGRRKSKT